MGNLTFREYTAGFILFIFSVAMMINFSGSVFKTYDANVSSDTLQEIKGEAEAAQPSVGQYSNRTQNIDIQDNSFLSPSGFGIVQDLFGSTTKLGSIASTAVGELGLPGGVLLVLIGIPVAGLIYQALSLLFGYNA